MVLTVGYADVIVCFALYPRRRIPDFGIIGNSTILLGIIRDRKGNSAQPSKLTLQGI